MRTRVPRGTLLVAIGLLVAACAAAGPSAQPSDLAPAAAPTSSSGASAAAHTPLWVFGPADDAAGVAFTGSYTLGPAGVVLDGVTAMGTTAAPGPLDTTRSFTVEGWGSLDTVAPFTSIASQNGQVASAFYLGLADGAWAFSMKDQDTSEPGHTIRAVGDGSPETGRWTHLAGVFDADAGEIRLYVDGALAATTPYDAPWQAAGPLVIGGAQSHANPSDFWPGAIARVALYQEALDVKAIAALQSTRPVSAPAAYGAGVPTPVSLRGTWDYVLSDPERERLASMFSPEEVAETGIRDKETRIRMGFDGRRFWQGFVFDGTLWMVHGAPEGDGGIMTVVGDTMKQTNGTDGWASYQWGLEGDELSLRLTECVADDGSSCQDMDIVRFVTEHTYTRSSSDPGY